MALKGIFLCNLLYLKSYFVVIYEYYFVKLKFKTVRKKKFLLTELRTSEVVTQNKAQIQC